MKKKECIIHVGMHKTGSSSIQVSFHTKIKSDKVCYFNLETANHSRRILHLFSKKHSSDIEKENIKNRMLESIEQCKSSRMLLSGEGIVKLKKNELEELKAFLNDYFENITIVAYIRSPKSFMESAFQQVIKDGTYAFSPEKLYPQYRNKFRKFDLVFGLSNVYLWKFDPKTFYQGDVVMDFCHRLGIEVSAKNTIRVNDSLSKEALSLLYIYGKHASTKKIHTDMKYKNSLLKVLHTIGQTKIHLSPSLILPILQKNAQDIVWMEKRLGESLDETIVYGTEDIENENDMMFIDSKIVETLKDILGFNYRSSKEHIGCNNEILALVSALMLKIS